MAAPVECAADLPRAERSDVRDVSGELTQFAPFEASRTISSSFLPYRGEPTKPPQVEINDGSYLGQPKVLFRKLRSTASSGGRPEVDRGSPRGTPDPDLSRSAGAVGGSRRVRVRVVGGHLEEPGAGRRGRIVESESGRVTKSVVLNRIGTLGKDQVRAYTSMFAMTCRMFLEVIRGRSSTGLQA